ncbi:S16 family serine protease [Desulfobacter postgatei]|jgi:hypothetical protein|uniref:S16 family serine protease n=1 Tax=Desulfobacter postgatei TaxID=2293 RepID=UPI002A35CD7C|nr:S16 family serine protease [Desulfobacter postgatei]MDX9963598.1 S16 family serine protease [Desulfobacter postgatei]
MQSLIFIATSPGDKSLLESGLMNLSKGLKYNPTLASFDDDLHTIQSSGIPSHLKTLFYRRLWTDHLLDPAPVPGVRDCLARHCPWETLLMTDMETPGSGRWIKIPVLVARNQSARVVWFIAGLISSASSDLLIPPWARKLMDTKFKENIRCAEQWVRHACPAVSDRRFVVFPLAVDSGMIQFTGGSAALALGLGMKSLVAGQPVSPDLIATGCLDDNGGITSVGCLDQKVNGALEEQFKCVLHPVQSAPSQALQAQSHRQMTFYGVSRFDMAWTLATLYSDQHASLLHDFTMALEDAGLFIDKMARFPGQWLGYQKSVVQALLADIFADMSLFSRFARTFSDMVREYSRHDTALALTELAPDAVPGKWPMAGLIWCTANLALFNHRGETSRARIWEQQGKAMAEHAITLDADLAVEFFNTLLVNAHNRFEFTTDLPGSLNRLLALLETRHTVMAASGCVIDQALGRLYGTLVQNTAFSGPRYIDATEVWSRKALQALGENSSPELEPEWMRQYSYLGTARLCAADMEGARACLFKYLEVENAGQIASKIPHFKPFQIKMLARFSAEDGIPVPDTLYTRLVVHVKKRIRIEHPWQLICFNLGRAALLRHDKKNARALFEQSLEICRDTTLGPTIGIMLLKPLAFLKDLVPAAEFNTEAGHWEAQAKTTAGQLNLSRFAFLFDRSFSSALQHVHRHHDDIFPYTYQ